jgi:hypothetical protein
MTEAEKIYWQYYASIQVLFGATDQEVETDQALREGIESMTRLVLKWRSDKIQRTEQEMKSRLLKEIGIPTLKPKGKP